MIAYAVRPRPIEPQKPPARDRKYLSFVRSLPCCVCKSHRGIEAAHVGVRGLGQKSCDFYTIPLCRKHHRGDNGSLHHLGRAAFEAQHRIEIGNLVDQLRTLFGGCNR